MLLAGLFLTMHSLADDGVIRLEIQRSAQSNHVAVVSFAATPGTLCRLYASQDLAVWQLRQSTVASAEAASFALPTAAGVSAFFRVAVMPVRPLEQMVWLESGEFVMGSPPDEVGRFLDKEGPQTRVTLTRGFWMSRFEVTQQEFETLMAFNPSLFKGDPQRPVEDVTWVQAVNYCAALTDRERQAGHVPEGFAYRLPTEAEWEYAARAGTTTRFSYGDDPGYEHLRDYAWYGGNSGLRPHPVGQKLPNSWGLYDVHGNVFEWCSDWFGQLPGGSRWVLGRRTGLLPLGDAGALSPNYQH
jgi:formylglycine-generating enzyme required for sulfatase activity